MSIILKKYGITLQRISQDDIELIRHWRNNPEINRYMAYREHISPLAQLQWFERINNPYNYYFLIIYENKKIGIINTKNINTDEGFGEGGIFIWDKIYWRTQVPTFATLIILEFTFEVINDFDFSIVRVMTDNIAAIRYNRTLGYVLIPEQYSNDQMYILTRRKYKTKTKKLIQAAEQLTNDKQAIRYEITHSPLNLEVLNQIANIQTDQPN